MNRKVLIVGAIVVLPLLALLWVSFSFNPKVVESPLLGKEAPPFTLNDLDGNTYDLEALRGKPVVINFWATYCVPCIAEHPLLVAASQRYANDIHLLGVVYQDDPALIRRFVNERGRWGPSLVDPGSRVALAYGVFGPPETFFIDRNGKVAHKVIGAVTPDDFVRFVEELI